METAFQVLQRSEIAAINDARCKTCLSRREFASAGLPNVMRILGLPLLSLIVGLLYGSAASVHAAEALECPRQDRGTEQCRIVLYTFLKQSDLDDSATGQAITRLLRELRTHDGQVSDAERLARAALSSHLVQNVFERSIRWRSKGYASDLIQLIGQLGVEADILQMLQAWKTVFEEEDFLLSVDLWQLTLAAPLPPSAYRWVVAEGLDTVGRLVEDGGEFQLASVMYHTQPSGKLSENQVEVIPFLEALVNFFRFWNADRHRVSLLRDASLESEIVDFLLAARRVLGSNNETLAFATFPNRSRIEYSHRQDPDLLDRFLERNRREWENALRSSEDARVQMLTLAGLCSFEHTFDHGTCIRVSSWAISNALHAGVRAFAVQNLAELLPYVLGAGYTENHDPAVGAEMLSVLRPAASNDSAAVVRTLASQAVDFKPI